MDDNKQYMPPEAIALAEKTKGEETPELRAYQEKAQATANATMPAPLAEQEAAAEPETPAEEQEATVTNP